MWNLIEEMFLIAKLVEFETFSFRFLAASADWENLRLEARLEVMNDR